MKAVMRRSFGQWYRQMAAQQLAVGQAGQRVGERDRSRRLEMGEPLARIRDEFAASARGRRAAIAPPLSPAGRTPHRHPDHGDVGDRGVEASARSISCG
ncbi:hypothetical protein AB5I41_08615 [Sphingomonas sp. MMS24-JH45]